MQECDLHEDYSCLEVNLSKCNCVSSLFKFLIVFFDLLDLTVLFASPESQLDMEVTTETSSEWAMQGVL